MLPIVTKARFADDVVDADSGAACTPLMMFAVFELIRTLMLDESKRVSSVSAVSPALNRGIQEAVYSSSSGNSPPHLLW